MAMEHSPDSVIMFFDTLSDLPSSIFGLPSTQTILRSTLGQIEFVSKYNMKDYPLAFFSYGCTSGGTHYSNCSYACTYPIGLFFDPETWWTCLSLTALALERSFFNMSQSVTAEIDVVLSKLGVNNITDFDGISVLNRTLQCAMAPNPSNYIEKNYPKFNSGAIDFIEAYVILSEVCSDVFVDISIDIAGSGILISYATQGIIAIASWALMRVFTARAAMDSFLRPFLRFKRINGAFAKWNTRLTSPLQQIEQTSLSHATSALLVEFQEAQCFFIFAIAIALLYADSRVLDFYDATCWQNIAENKIWVTWLASQGVWSIILTQISLRYIGLDSIYSLVLSTTAVALIAAAAATTMDPDPEMVYAILSRAGVMSFEECDFAPTLKAFCLDDATIDYPRTISIFLNIPLLLIYIFFWWEKLIGAALNNLIVRMGFYMRINSFGTVLAKLRYTILELKAVLATIMEFWVVSYLGISLNRLISWMWSHREFMQLSTGQVVSMLVWAPVISKYFYLIAMGIENGFKMRLPGVFAVLRIQDPAQTEHSERAQSFNSGSEQTHTG